MTQIKIKASKENIDKAILKIEKDIKTRHIPEKNIGSFLLYAEEILLQLISKAEKTGNTIQVRISGKKDNVKANFSCPGKELVLDETFVAKDMVKKAKFDDEQTIIISKMILKANSDKISVHYKKGINYAQLNTATKQQKSAGLLTWMLAGILFGFLIKWINVSVISSASSQIFSMVSTMFMNAIKMLVTPLVFFSIAESVSGFSDLGAFGRLGGKIILTYVAFSIVALFLASGVFFIIKPGSTDLAAELYQIIGSSEIAQGTISLKDTIVDIVPSGFITAFAQQNMLQIIFIAILTGFASGKLGQNTEKVQSFISAGNSLFSQLITIVIKTLKPVCFCMMANVSMTLSGSSFIQQFKLILCIMCTIVVLVIVYGLYIAIVGKTNPFVFFKKFKKVFFVAFSTMSSSATIPTSMQCCDDLGVSPKVYSFSIPLGATINMNASCIFFITSTLFLARILGIPITITNLIPLIFSSLLLAVSAPGIPGAALACIAILFAQVGIPAGAVGYIIGVYTITDGFLTAINVMGDSVTTYAVSKSEGMLK